MWLNDEETKHRPGTVRVGGHPASVRVGIPAGSHSQSAARMEPAISWCLIRPVRGVLRHSSRTFNLGPHRIRGPRVAQGTAAVIVVGAGPLEESRLGRLGLGALVVGGCNEDLGGPREERSTVPSPAGPRLLL